MRSFEILLLLALSVALLMVSLPHWRGTRWPRLSAIVSLLIGASQILAEGPRWQLLPAYALTVLLCGLSMLASRSTAGGSGTALVVSNQKEGLYRMPRASR